MCKTKGQSSAEKSEEATASSRIYVAMALAGSLQMQTQNDFLYYCATQSLLAVARILGVRIREV